MFDARAIRIIGYRSINAVWRIGKAVHFLFLILRYSGSSLRRFRLIIK